MIDDFDDFDGNTELRIWTKEMLRNWSLLALKEAINVDTVKNYQQYTNIIKIGLTSGVNIRILHLDTTFKIELSKGKKELESLELNGYDEVRLLSKDKIKEIFLHESMARHL
ncbi:MAG: hypothetical protein ACPG62_09395 [Cycloclasticus sp.]